MNHNTYLQQSPDSESPKAQERLSTLARHVLVSSMYLDSLRSRGVREDSEEQGYMDYLLHQERFFPVAGIELDSGTYSISAPLSVPTDERKYSVGYFESDDGAVAPRLFYKSMSDGGWRAAPFIDGRGCIYKGGKQTREEFGEYVATTKPDESLAALLEYTEHMYDTSSANMGIFMKLMGDPRWAADFDNQVRYTTVSGDGLDAFVSGHGYEKYGAEIGRTQLESMQLPKGFEPDFQTSARDSYGVEHSILGRSTVEVYASEYDGMPIEWHVATDGVGRVWLDRLQFAHSETTTYGTRRNVLLAGALQMKPVDYWRQLAQAEEYVDWVPLKGQVEYVDMQPTIQRMPWVKRYRDARANGGRDA